MKKRFFPTFVAIVIFAVLYVYANKYEIEPIPNAGEDNPVLLCDFRPSDVKSITWKKGTPDEIKVECKTEEAKTSYTLVKPHQWRGDESEIGGLLRNFEDFNSERIIAVNASDSSIYGISTQSQQLHVELATKTYIFTLGSNNPIGNSVYFMRDGDPTIYLVKGVISPAFNKTFNELRAKNIFPEDFTGVNSVELFNGTDTFKMQKPTGEEWKIVEPKICKADSTEVSTVIFSTHDIKAARFVQDEWDSKQKDEKAEELDKFGFEKPFCKVSFSENASKSWQFIVGKEENGERYVRRSDSRTVYAVPSSILTVLDKTFNNLRTKDLPVVDKKDVKKVSLRSNGTVCEIEPASPTWKCNGKDVDEPKLNAMFEALRSNRVKDFFPTAETEARGLSKPGDAERIEFVTASGTTSFVFGKGEATHISILIEGRDEIFSVPIQMHESFKALYDSVKPQPKTENATSTPASISATTVTPVAVDAVATSSEIKPAVTEEKPVEEAQPATVDAVATSSEIKPAVTEEKPVEEAQPAAVDAVATSSEIKPAVTEEKPVEEAQPAAVDAVATSTEIKPAVTEEKPVEEAQPAAVDAVATSTELKPAVTEEKAVEEAQPAAVDAVTTSTELKPAVIEEKPVEEAQPAAVDAVATSTEIKPAVTEEKPVQGVSSETVEGAGSANN
ncbi:MAG: DUF4340 domain-containing protein [Candidatus Riflebacteria bacterium]|nr:DUF4340 domain-containing protein [Candidatus Riflebacteria bacterium]